MSIFSKAWKSVRSVAAPLIGAAVGGPLGGIVGTALAGSAGKSVGSMGPFPVPSNPYFQQTALPGIGGLARLLPALPGIGGAAVGVAVRGAGAAMRGAIAMCRKHPQWCSTIGGTAAVAAMIEGGQIPAPRRRRSRGISGTEFRAFRRVHNVLSKFCAPRMKVKRSKSCR